MKMFEGKVVLVTGGNRNTGLWIVKKFVDEGARVFMCGSSEASTAKGVEALKAMGVAATLLPAASGCLAPLGCSAEAARGTGLGDAAGETHRGTGTVLAQACDVGDKAQVAALMDLIEREAGTLDILVNNAADQGINLGGPLEMDPDAILKVMGTNVRGGFQVTQAACNRFFMKRPRPQVEIGGGGREALGDRGVVVFLSSNTAQRAIRNRTAYCASKGAINAMVRALALDLSPLGIRVNACAPGYIYTERWDVLEEAKKARRRANCPLGREAQGADIANVVAFLASDLSANMTGEVVTCDAGCSAQHMPADVDC